MKKCALCEQAARMYCESDRASLCWDCDSKVHGANFLVARHTRCLLCRACQAPTPWKASGSRLGPTVSVCENCMCSEGNAVSAEAADGAGLREVDYAEEDDDEMGLDTESDSEEEDDEEEEEEEEDGENQVVPWSFPGELDMLPPMASASSSEQSSSSSSVGYGYVSWKRENADLGPSKGDAECSRHLLEESEASSELNAFPVMVARPSERKLLGIQPGRSPQALHFASGLW